MREKEEDEERETERALRWNNFFFALLFEFFRICVLFYFAACCS